MGTADGGTHENQVQANAFLQFAQEQCLQQYIEEPTRKNIIIIIKKDWQCKAGRGRLSTYQSEDPSPTLPTYRGKEEKGKIVEDKKGESNEANKKALDLLLKSANPTPSNMGSTRSFQRDTKRGIKVLRYCEVLQRGGAKVYRCAIKAPRVTRTGT